MLLKHGICLSLLITSFFINKNLLADKLLYQKHNQPTTTIPPSDISANTQEKLSYSQEKTDKPESYKEYNPHVDVTPTARGCPNSSGPYVQGAFIYWKSQLEKEDIIEKVRTQSNDITFSQKVEQKELDFHYSPGFKLGLGYNFKRDFWDVFLNWTLFTYYLYF